MCIRDRFKIDEQKIYEMINSNNALEVYRHSFDDLFRFRKHTLEKEQEELLSMASEVTQVPYNTYSLFTCLLYTSTVCVDQTL